MTDKEYLYHASVMNRIYITYLRIYLIFPIVSVAMSVWITQNLWCLLGIPAYFLGGAISKYLVVGLGAALTVIFISTDFITWGYYLFLLCALVTGKYLFSIPYRYRLREKEFKEKAMKENASGSV